MRTILEWGSGADLHGGNVQKAVERAINDAIHRSCLDINETNENGRFDITVRVGCPDSSCLDKAAIENLFPVGKIDEILVSYGGLKCPNGTVIANAAIEISVD